MKNIKIKANKHIEKLNPYQITSQDPWLFTEKIDWLLIRTISDGADDKASQDFSSFLSNYKYHSFSLIKAIFDILIN